MKPSPIAPLLAAAALALAAGLAACEVPLPEQKLPELTYSHLEPFRLDVASIEVISEYRPPMQAPNVEHLFSTPPEKALKQWAADRLKAAGPKGTARFIIGDDSVTETKLSIDTGFTGMFKKEQSERYDASVEAVLNIFDERGYLRGYATARVTRSRTVREDITLNERERQWFLIVEAMMKDFNAELERNIRQQLGGYLF